MSSTSSTSPALRLAVAAAVGLLPGVALGFLGAPDGSTAPGSIEGSSNDGVEETADATTRTPVTAPTSSVPVTESTDPIGRALVEAIEDDLDPEVARTLLDELHELLASGRIERSLSERGGLHDLLVRLYVAAGEAERALAMIDGIEDTAERMRLYDVLIAQALVSAPEVVADAADRALRLHLSGFTGDAVVGFEYPVSHLMNTLATIDPSRALDLLALLRSSGMEDNTTVTFYEVRLLAAAGLLDNARQIATSMLEDPQLFTQGIEALMQCDVQLAEQELRNALEGNNGAWARQRLLGMLAEQGRTSEAIVLFEDALAAGLADESSWNALLYGLPKNMVDAHVDAWLAMVEDPSIATLQSVANYYAGQGDTWSTLEAYKDLWAKALESGSWLQQLPYDVVQAHPSEVLALLDSAIASDPSSDEVWGDLADAYWQAGAEAEAVAAWEKAHEMDPGDSEWTGKLDKAENGQDPIWVPEDLGLGDTSDLYPQSSPLHVYDSANPWGWGHGGYQPWMNEPWIYEEGFLNAGFPGQVDFGTSSILSGIGYAMPPPEVQFFEEYDVIGIGGGAGGLQVLEELGYSEY